MSDATTRPLAGTQKDYDEIVATVERRYRTNINQAFNGSTKFVNSMLSVLVLLIVAAICGEVVVYGEVQVLQDRVNMIIAGRYK